MKKIKKKNHKINERMILTFNKNMLIPKDGTSNVLSGIYHFTDSDTNSSDQVIEIFSLGISSTLKEYQKYTFFLDDSHLCIYLLNNNSSLDNKSGFVFSKSGSFSSYGDEIKISNTPTNDIYVEIS